MLTNTCVWNKGIDMGNLRTTFKIKDDHVYQTGPSLLNE